MSTFLRQNRVTEKLKMCWFVVSDMAESVAVRYIFSSCRKHDISAETVKGVAKIEFCYDEICEHVRHKSSCSMYSCFTTTRTTET